MLDLQSILGEIAKQFGWQVGDKVRVEINKILELNNVDTKDIEEKIKTIQSILDADPDTEEFDVAQNIITQLKDILGRIANLEADNKANKDEIEALKSQLAEDEKRIKALEDQDTVTSDELNALSKRVDGKADQETLENVQKDLNNKASQTDLEALNKKVSEKANQTDLDALSKKVSEKANQTDLDALNKKVDNKADKTELENNYISKEEISSVDVSELASLFRSAMNCGYEGTVLEDCNTNKNTSSSNGNGGDGEAI